ncbi:MAG: hypothetical protein ACK5MT_04560 [Actinomycetales bacterium]
MSSSGGASRRPLWFSLATVAVIGAVAGGLVIGQSLDRPDPVTPPTGTPLPTRSVEDFVGSVGVNVHLSYRDTGYRDGRAVVAAVDELCISHVRDNLAARPGANLPATYRQLADHGIDVDLVVGSPGAQERLPEPTAALDWIRENDLAPTPVAAIEGPNEWDQRGGTDWADEVVDYQQSLASEVRSQGPSGVTLVAPSTSRTDRRSQLGDLSTVTDVASNHDYPDAGPPDVPSGRQLEHARGLVGDKPVWVTETGYQTSGQTQNGQPPVTPHQQAVYLPRLVASSFAAGVERTYLYELLDDPTGSDRQLQFGLMSADFDPKPAYSAMSRLLCTLREGTSGGPADPADAPDIWIDPVPAGVSTLALTGADGSAWLLSWRTEAAGRDADGSDAATVPVQFTMDREVTVRSLDVTSNTTTTEVRVPAGSPHRIDLGEGLVLTSLSPA